MKHLNFESHASLSFFVAIFFFLFSGTAFSLTLEKQVVLQTPYDAYLGPFRAVTQAPAGNNKFTIDAMEKWTREAHRIRYERAGEYEWKSPEEVERTATGDCKDKALWLYSKLRAAGATALELVIGKQNLSDAEFHAWVIAVFEGRSYLLDPASRGSVWEMSDFEWNEYVPFYSYDARNAFAYKFGKPSHPPEVLRRDFGIVLGACPSTLCPL